MPQSQTTKKPRHNSTSRELFAGFQDGNVITTAHMYSDAKTNVDRQPNEHHGCLASGEYWYRLNVE